MLQNRTISSSLSPAVPSEWGVLERRALLRDHYSVLSQTLRLPDTLQSFLLFTVAIIVICAGFMLHLQLATTILQSRLELERLQAQKAELSQQAANLTWTIAQETDLEQLLTKATALGYQPALQREYVMSRQLLFDETSGGIIGDSQHQETNQLNTITD